MKTLSSSFTFSCLAALLASLWIAGPASAQDPPRFRVTDLGPLGPNFTEDPDGEGTFGISNRGEVVYSMDVNNVRHAMLWLPYPAYGHPAGNHDLAEPGLFPTFAQPSIAGDISVYGKVIGQAGGIVAEVGEAMVWDLASGTLQPLGFLPDGGWSRGFAITDSVPAVVIGESEYLDMCPQYCAKSNPPLGLFVQSFEATLSGGSPVLVPLETDCGESSLARDVSTVSGGTLVAGFAETHATEAVCSAIVPECPNEGKDAVLWLSPTSLVVLPDLDGPPPLFRDSEARGVNAIGESLGWGFRSNTALCRPDGLYWNAALGLTNLGLYMPLNQAGNESRAEAINSLPLPHVVGWNVSAELALLWEKQPGTPAWIGTDVNTVIGPCGGPLGNIVLRQGHDINDSSWIICVGRPDLGTERHAYVLTPIVSCLWDLNDDWDVGPADLAYLLTNWGPCTDGLSCFADFDCSGVVGPEDLAALLTNWGPCPESGGGDGQGGDGGSDEDVGWPELEQLLQWLIEEGQDDLAALLQEVWQDMDTP